MAELEDAAGNIGKGASLGATIGSAIPGIGTLVGGAAGALVGLGVSYFGGMKAAAVRRKKQAYLDQQISGNNAWYNANALGDYTQTANAQNLMKQMRESLQRQNRVSSNRAVVTGATPEQQAVSKQLANQAISNTYSSLGAMGENYMQQITNKYLSRKDNFAAQNMGIMEGNAQSYENLMQNGLNMASGYSGQLLRDLGKYVDNKTQIKTKTQI
jgi:hypothetical protein